MIKFTRYDRDNLATQLRAFSSMTIQKQLNPFTTAFFDYYLQGQEEYTEYLTADFVDQFENLA
jgi:hypothetical protein